MNGSEFIVGSEYLFRANIFFEVYEERVASRDGVNVLGCHVNSQKYKPCEYRLSNLQLSNKMFDILLKKNLYVCLRISSSIICFPFFSLKLQFITQLN